MNAETFCEHLATFADAPNGVEKLREMVLQLAVQGKLVPQNEDDEPATVLIRCAFEASAESRPGTKAKRSQRTAMQSSTANLPECPSGWEWTTLGELGIVSPRNELPNDTDVSFLPMAAISTEYNGPLQPETRKWGEVKQGFTHVADGDVAMAKITPCFQNGKTTVMRGLSNGYGAGTTELHVLRPYPNCVLPEYAVIFLRSPQFVFEGVARMSGSAGQQRVPKEHFAESPFPLPPLAEQMRIVGKVDQLMALCDELAARQAARRQARERLVGATLDRLVSAHSTAEFPVHARRLRDNFDRLFDTPKTVPQLRQAILQLAVQGQLVPQYANDEPAYESLQRLSREKLRLVKEKHIQRQPEFAKVGKDEISFPLPLGWDLAKLGRIGFVTKLAGFEYTKHIRLTDTGEIPVIRAQNVRNNYVDETNLKYIDLSTSTKLARSALTKPALLVTFIGAGIGDVATFSRTERWHLAPNVAKVEPYNAPGVESIDIAYLQYFLMAPVGRTEIFKHLKSTAQPSLSMETIRDINIAVPPLGEQKRIVSKVTELMSLCDALEANLTRVESVSDELMSAAVSKLMTFRA